MNGKVARIVLLSLASGIVWAGVALLVGQPMGRVIWGGVIVSPFIGLAAGFVSAWFPSEGLLRRAAFSFVSLYVAAAVFGLAMGVYDLATGQNYGDGWRRRPAGVVLQAVPATLWGLTVPGYFIVLWPMAYANHAFLARAWNEDAG